ncbi:ABC-three component system middle component 2 [Alkalinema pantanalense CENA528]|uniref:ABC-three component system middle component 2 n=1 Tax=Alkalinema pantanalense TaxID=1620705 RepID=UPI003D6E568E
MTSPFNSPLEIGIRSLIILTAVYPRSLDLQFLVFFDYFTVHSGDVQGPDSLHAPLPLRSGELTVKRGLIERGLLLMLSRGLVEHLVSSNGFEYRASDNASAFLSMLSSPYITQLRERAEWVAEAFGNSSLHDLKEIEKNFFRNWSTQFQPLEIPGRQR